MVKEKEDTKGKTTSEEINQDTSLETEKSSEENTGDPKADKTTSESSGKKSRKTKTLKDKQAEKLQQLESELKICEDKYIRLYSDFDNYRRRTSKERIELSKTASAELMESLLTVLDDFERAQKAMNASEDIKAVKEGVALIYNKLLDILKRKGLEEINCIGEDFNTDYHEAITNIPAESEDMKGKIIDQTEKGYLLNGIILRYAKVVVGS